MIIIAADNETKRFSAIDQTPAPVCLSYAEIELSARRVGARGVLAYNYPSPGGGLALDAWWHWLQPGANVLIVGANTAFDVLTSIVGAYRKSEKFGREIHALFVRAYNENRITDVFSRQKLLDLAIGCYRWEERDNGSWIAYGYALDDLVKRHTGRRLSKPGSDGTDPAEHWRLRFGELDGVPVESYPRPAYDYSLDDSVGTGEVYLAQEFGDRGGKLDPRIARNFGGYDPLPTEFAEVRAALPLKATSAYGLRTDSAAVERLAEDAKAEHRKLTEELVRAGLVRREWHKHKRSLTDYVRAKGYDAPADGSALAATPFQFNAKGEVLLSTAALLASGDPLLAVLADWRSISKGLKGDGADAATALGRLAPLLEAGIVRDVKVNTKAICDRVWRAYADPKSLDSDVDGVDALPRPVPRTDKWAPSKNPKHTPESRECVKRDADACDASGDFLLGQYAEFSSLAKTISTDIPILRSGAVAPIHTRFEEILETARVASSKPNVMNVRRLPGIRECFVPRQGFVLSDTDFPSLELNTLAQICLWLLGYSKLAEALNSGKDPHLQMAATIAGISYNEAKRRYKEEHDPLISNYRTAGKGVNFGRPGGLGKKKFAEYAYKSYGVRLLVDPDPRRPNEMSSAVLIKQYDDTWTEMPEYFKWIESLKAPYDARKAERLRAKYQGEELRIKLRELDRYNVIHPGTGMLRAGASYCAACNSPFQHLGAVTAKLAGWLIWQACCGLLELGDADPLFGSHPVNMIHDQWICEVPEEKAHEASIRQAALMDRAAKLTMPDMSIKVEPMITRQWSKKAELWTDDGSTGGGASKALAAGRRMIPWDLRVACAKDRDAWLKLSADEQRVKTKSKDDAGFAGNDRASVYRYLVKAEWPRDAAREAIDDAFGPAGQAAAA